MLIQTWLCSATRLIKGAASTALLSPPFAFLLSLPNPFLSTLVVKMEHNLPTPRATQRSGSQENAQNPQAATKRPRPTTASESADVSRKGLDPHS